MSKLKPNCPLYKKIQKVHQKSYEIPKSFELKGFVLLHEERNDILCSFTVRDDESVLSAYTNQPDKFLILSNMEDAKYVVDLIGRPLIICAIHADADDLMVCDVQVSPIFLQVPEPI